MASTKKLYAALGRRGPHRVQRGDLAIVGLPGVVYAPASGSNLPGVAFGHGWMTHSRQYEQTLEHLASWGIVVAAPNTQRGPLGSDRALAADLTTALSVISEVALGDGSARVHPERLGLIGHGAGASAAIIAAGNTDTARCLAALFPAPTSAAVLPAAHRARIPALTLAADDDLDGLTSNALAVRNASQHPDSWLATVAKASHRGLAEGFSVRRYLGDQSAQKKTQKITRAVVTGFLLGHLTTDKTYAEFTHPNIELPGITAVDPTTVTQPHLDPISKLLRT